METIKMDSSLISDNPDLQNVIKVNHLEGDIRVSFARHPDFFHSVDILGFQNDVMVARNRLGKAVGVGIRSIKKVYIDGEIRDIGYLSGLRLNNKYRNSLALARSFLFLKKIHDKHPVPFYFSTIVKKNHDAIRVLTSQKAGLPIFEALGIYNTFAVHLPLRKRKVSDVKIVSAEEFDMNKVLNFINLENSKKQFAPFYEKDLASCNNRYRGLKREDIYVALVNDEIVGVVAKWDQKDYKQNIVVGYSKKMRLFRFFFNAYAKLRRISPLPSVGSELNSFYLSFVAIKDKNENVFDALIRRVCDDNAHQGYLYFLLGLNAEDRLSNFVAKRYTHTLYESIFYRVCWKEEQTTVAGMSNQPFFHELALM